MKAVLEKDLKTVLQAAVECVSPSKDGRPIVDARRFTDMLLDLLRWRDMEELRCQTCRYMHYGRVMIETCYNRDTSDN